MPSAPAFGEGIPTYIVEGVIPEANSVRLRIALEKGDNRTSNPSIVSDNLLYQRDTSPSTGGGPGVLISSSLLNSSGTSNTNVLDPYLITSFLIPSASFDNDYRSIFASASQQSGSGNGVIEINYG